MTSNTTPFDVPPDAAMEQLASFPGPLIVDLDETLYLRNSTEDFLDSARPGILALLVLRLLDFVKPWRWTGGLSTRDVWRVKTISWLFPWIWIVWRSRVAGLASEYSNRPLLSQLESAKDRVTVATVGFLPIVRPLVAAMGLQDVRLVATDEPWLATRRSGKLPMVEGAIGADTVGKSLVLTDSVADMPLLEHCSRPLRTVWPEARFRRALSRIYLPGDYTAFVKRPGERYLSRSVLKEDLGCWLFASISLASAPLTHAIGLTLLMVSFWAMYELGYLDNDNHAARFESDPRLSSTYFDAEHHVGLWQPWAWVIGSGVAGLMVLRYPTMPTAFDAVAWFGVVIATFAWFRLYNRYNKATRVWMFAVLQFSRGAAFLAVVPAAPIGIAIIGALTLGRWVPYYHYRARGTWDDARPVTTRLLFFVMLSGLLALVEDPGMIMNGTALAFLIFTIFSARHELKNIYAEASRIDTV